MVQIPEIMKNMKQIVIMLGGNLPGTGQAMATAVEKFRMAGVQNIRCSRAMMSAAEDCVPGTPDFLDMAMTGSWCGTPGDLLALCQQIECEAGRPAHHSSRESRILDCDIILFGEEVIDSPDLTIPHPRAHLREFVLRPLAEISPQTSFPDGMTVLEKLHRLEAGYKPDTVKR